jgi:AcrR family transcriptional regulator
MRTSDATASRLGAGDWIEAGFSLIAAEGLRAVKIDRLSAALGVTKGSFYWHFADIGAYMDALARAWGEEELRSRAALTSMRELVPEKRLAAMMGHLTSPRQWTLERAVREWARWDPKVAARVHASDRAVFAEVQRTFVDAGFPAEEARVRAQASFAAGVGAIHLSTRAPRAADAGQRERFLEIMLRP